MQMAQSKVVFIYIFTVGSWIFIPTCLSLFHGMFAYLSLYVTPSTPLLSLSPIWMFHFSLTPRHLTLRRHPGLSSWQGAFLYENTPIGRQAPLSDTTCTCIDMKSVLTSTTDFCGAVETAYQWQCRSCDQIKEAAKFGDS